MGNHEDLLFSQRSVTATRKNAGFRTAALRRYATDVFSRHLKWLRSLAKFFDDDEGWISDSGRVQRKGVGATMPRRNEFALLRGIGV